MVSLVTVPEPPPATRLAPATYPHINFHPRPHAEASSRTPSPLLAALCASSQIQIDAHRLPRHPQLRDYRGHPRRHYPTPARRKLRYGAPHRLSRIRRFRLRTQRQPRRRVLLHLGRAHRVEGPIRPPNPRPHRLRLSASRQAPRPDAHVLLRRGHHPQPLAVAAKTLRAHGYRGRTLHRERPRPAPRLLPPRSPLHDPHLVQLQRVGGFLR